MLKELKEETKINWSKQDNGGCEWPLQKRTRNYEKKANRNNMKNSVERMGSRCDQWENRMSETDGVGEADGKSVTP